LVLGCVLHITLRISQETLSCHRYHRFLMKLPHIITFDFTCLLIQLKSVESSKFLIKDSSTECVIPFPKKLSVVMIMSSYWFMGRFYWQCLPSTSLGAHIDNGSSLCPSLQLRFAPLWGLPLVPLCVFSPTPTFPLAI